MRRASVCFVWSLLAFVVVFVFFLLVSPDDAFEASSFGRCLPLFVVAICLVCFTSPDRAFECRAFRRCLPVFCVFFSCVSTLRAELLNAARLCVLCGRCLPLLLCLSFSCLLQLSGRRV